MKELIFLNVGGAGTRIGDKTWEVLSKEHELTSPANSAPPSPLFDNNAICCELPSGRFSPRNLFIDSSPEVVDEVRKGCRRQLYNPSSCITGKEDTANNYVRGHYTLGKNILEICEQKIVNMLQACDHFNGIVLNCSMSGGTGSGLTTLILDRIRYNNILNKKPVQVNMLMPSPRISDSIVEPYNFVMGLGDLIGNDCSKYVVGFDNEQLYRLCEMKGIDEPGYSEINGLMGQSISAMTHPFRLSTGSESMTELATNLIPYPFATLVSPTFSATSDITKIPNTVSSLYRPALCMNSYRVFGRESIFSSYGILRGEITHFEGVNALTKAKKQFKFCDWNLTNLKLKTCPFLPKQSSGDSMVEGVMLINSDSCRGTLDRIHKKYDLLYEKRSFIHWYVGEGIDDESITSCRQNTAVLDRDYEEMAVESVEDYQQIFQ